MSKIISAILAVKEIFNTIKSLWGAYLDYKRRQSIEKTNKAIDKGDTIEIEKEIGSSNAGKPTKYRDGVNVRPKTNADRSGSVENES